MQVPVVRDDEQRAGEGVEQVLDRGEHVGVEVVGGLVEDQHVRLGEQDQQQLQAALLAAGEVLHRGRELGAGEADPLQQLGRRHLLAAGDVAALQPPDHLADPVVPDVLELAELLGQGGDLDGLAALDLARCRLQARRRSGRAAWSCPRR